MIAPGLYSRKGLKTPISIWGDCELYQTTRIAKKMISDHIDLFVSVRGTKLYGQNCFFPHPAAADRGRI